MSYFSGVTIINKPIGLCFDYITAPGYWPTYPPDSYRIKQEPDCGDLGPDQCGKVNIYNPLQLGSRCIEVAKVGFFKMDLHWETTTYERPYKFTITGHSIGGASLQITYTFSEVCEGVTSFKRVFEYHYKPLIMKILNLFYLRKVAYEDGAAALPGTKSRLEAMPCNVSRYAQEHGLTDP